MFYSYLSRMHASMVDGLRQQDVSGIAKTEAANVNGLWVCLPPTYFHLQQSIIHIMIVIVNWIFECGVNFTLFRIGKRFNGCSVIW